MSDPVKNGSCQARHIALRKLSIRSSFLFANFFLIILAYYQLKPAYKSFFNDAVGAQWLPYAWIGTALVMVPSIKFYNAMVERFSRLRVVYCTYGLAIGLLLLFYEWLRTPSAANAFAFYLLVDILGVVLVEQFWCLTNSIFTTSEGKSWYGFIGTGGLVGGAISGAAAAYLIKQTTLQTTDLLLVAAGIYGIILGLTWVMGTYGIYCESDNPAAHAHAARDLRALLKSRYLVLIAGMLFMGQVASLFIEFQFMNTLDKQVTDRDAQTAYLSIFYSVQSFAPILINLMLTPLVHKKGGAFAGLIIQPVLMAVSSFCFLFSPVLNAALAMKFSDKGLSYSINRASKELLYVPISPAVIYQSKAWIDMFGYRMFKGVGSVLILAMGLWLPVAVTQYLSLLTIGICIAWVAIILLIRKEYLAFGQN